MKLQVWVLLQMAMTQLVREVLLLDKVMEGMQKVVDMTNGNCYVLIQGIGEEIEGLLLSHQHIL